jgi:hypothetical protein
MPGLSLRKEKGMQRSFRSYILLGVLLAALAGTAGAADGPGWVGLYTQEMIEVLENQNRIDRLCPPTQPQALREACRRERLSPRTWTLDVREHPSLSSARTGSIRITATPGSGLTFAYAGQDGTVQFLPDLFDADWGYGPYFHQTYRDRRGSWFELPKGPLPGPGWIDMSRLGPVPDVRDIEAGQVYLLNSESFFLIGIREGSVTFRPEQPADQWCREGEPPALTPFQARTFPVRELYDADGHLILKIKYLRGC